MIHNKENRIQDSSCLHKAVEAGHVDKVTLLLENDALDIDNRAEDGRTSLHIAVQRRHLQIVKLLVKRGADIGLTMQDGRSSLQLASGPPGAAAEFLNIIENCAVRKILGSRFESDLPLVEFLVKAGATVDATNTEEGWTVLHEAVHARDYNLSNLLIELGANPRLITESGHSCLHIAAAACRSRDWEMVRLMVRLGLPLNARDKAGRSPLLIAAILRRMEVVKELVKSSANPHDVEKKGWSCLHWAARHDDLEIASYLLDLPVSVDLVATPDEDRTPLHLAMENNHLRMARLLVERGAKPTATMTDGRSCLHLASAFGSPDLTEFILKSSPEGFINFADKMGRTAWHLAAIHNQLDVVEFLGRNCRPNFHGVDKAGHSALFYADRIANIRMVQHMLNVGAEIGTTDEKGSRALMYAVQQGNCDFVRFLFEKGFNKHAIFEDGRSYLHGAAANPNAEMMRLLVSHDLNPNSVDNTGTTPLMVCAAAGHTDIASILIGHGAKAERLNKNGESCREMAVANKRCDMVTFFDTNKSSYKA